MVIKQISTFTIVYGDAWEATSHGEGTCKIEFQLGVSWRRFFKCYTMTFNKIENNENKKKRVEEDSFGEYLMINEICTSLF